MWKRLEEHLAFRPEKMAKISLFDSEHAFCDAYCLEPGQTQKPHTHAGADKFYVVTSGRGTFHLAGDDVELDAGHVVHAAPGVEHGVTNSSNDRLVLLVVMSPNPNR